MATRTKTTAAVEAEIASGVSLGQADADQTAAPAAKASVKGVAAKAPAAAKAGAAKKAPAAAKVAAKAPVKKAPVKRGSKAATSEDESGGPEDETEVVILDDAKDDDSKDDGSEDLDEEKEAKTSTEALPSGALVLSLVDDDDEVPVYSSAITGATADPVKDYLKQIGKVALLNAAEEVELAMRIEAGLFAEDKLSVMTPAELKSQLGRELTWVAKDGQRAKSHLLGANLRLVVSLAKRYTGR